jgi:hypothetical protein
MRLNEHLKAYPGLPGMEVTGDLSWDSETGEMTGSLAERIRTAALEAKDRGWIPAGPLRQEDLPIKDPLHRPDELAAVLLFLGFNLPAELLAIYHPEFPDPLEGATDEECERTVF